MVFCQEKKAWYSEGYTFPSESVFFGSLGLVNQKRACITGHGMTGPDWRIVRGGMYTISRDLKRTGQKVLDFILNYSEHSPPLRKMFKSQKFFKELFSVFPFSGY